MHGIRNQHNQLSTVTYATYLFSNWIKADPLCIEWELHTVQTSLQHNKAVMNWMSRQMLKGSEEDLNAADLSCE